MGELAQTLLYPVAFLALFTALGSAPVTLLAARLPGRGALMPIAGCAIAAVLLTDLTPVLSMYDAAWFVLLPAALVSLLVTLRLQRPGTLAVDSLELGAAAALALGGAAIALLPAFRAGSTGPFAFHIYDVLEYISVDDWLQAHSIDASLPAVDVHNLSLAYGHGVAAFSGNGKGFRVGVDTIDAAVSALVHAAPSQTIGGLMAILFGLGAATAWFGMRSVGLSRLAAAVSGLFSLSAGALVLVFDTAIGNLSGLVLGCTAVVCLFHSMASGDRRMLVLSGIVGGGLVALYPEFLLPTVAAGGFTVVNLLVAGRRKGTAWASLARTALGRCALVVGTVAVLAPVPIARAVEYVDAIVRQRSGGFGVPRTIGLDTFLPWLLGIAHVYELQTFQALHSGSRAFALGIACVIAALILLSFRRRPAVWCVLVAAPIGTGLALGLGSGASFSGGTCGYCQWKAWTFMLPFVGFGAGVAIDTIEAFLTRHLAGSEHPRLPPRLARWAVPVSIAGALIAPALVLGATDARLVHAQEASGSIVSKDLRAIATSVGRTGDHERGVLIEGSDVLSGFLLPAVYNIVTEGGAHQISLDAQNAFTLQYLGVGPDPSAYYRPDYAFVLSPYAGLSSGRVTLVREGNYALQRRAPIDVDLAGSGALFDASDGAQAIPWIAAPFDLWISSPSSTRAALTIRLEQSAGGTASVALLLDSRLLRISRLAPDTICATVDLGAGRTALHVVPSFNPIAASGAVPKVLGIRSLHARPGSCRTPS